MISFEVNHGNVKRMGISGNINDLLSEVVFAVGYIHSKIKAQSEDCGEIFKQMFLQLFRDPKMADFVFDFPDDEDEPEVDNENKQYVISNIDRENIQKQLAELMGNKNEDQ